MRLDADGLAESGAGPDQVHAAAARGIATPATPLPYRERIQQLFGRHDVSQVKAHVGDEATASAQQMGAQAYATGDHVVFGGGADLHTAAHEAAHVVQQRGGIHLKGGVGEDGDAYERHADEVADLVVQGKSAEAALERHAGGEAAQGVQMARRHDYNDPPIRNLAFTALERTNIQNQVNAANFTYTLANGEASHHLNQMGAIKAQIQQILRGVRNGINVNNIFGAQYALDVGIHTIRIWDNAVPNPAEIFHFDITVIPHGGTANDATVADAQWQTSVNNMTFLDAIARPFRENHTTEPIAQSDEERALVALAIERQKASTLIQLTATAQTDLLAEVRHNTQAGTFTTKHHFVTANTYPMLDINPATNPPTLTAFDATFEYDVFHNPNTKFWQISHFHGAVAKANIRNIANGTAGVQGAVSKTDAVLAFGGLAGNMAAGNHNVTITTNRALTMVRVQLDDGRWLPATVDPLNNLQWTYDWTATVGAHVIRAEGQENRGRRTRTISRNVNVT